MSTQEEGVGEPDAWEVLMEALLKALAMVAVPMVWLDRDAPWYRRPLRWWRMYLVFLLVAVGAFFAHPVYILTFPVIHFALPVVWFGGNVGYQPTGNVVPITVPGVSDTVVVGVGTGIAVSAVLYEVVRRKTRFGSAPSYHVAEDEMLVPMQDISDTSVLFARPPRFETDTSVVTLGETGSGKSSAMRLLAAQYLDDEETAIIVHESGTGFEEFYRDRGKEVVRLRARGSDEIWNLFREVETEADFREVADAIFGEESGRDPFHGPAKQVFAATLQYLHREADRQDASDALAHDDIVQFLNQSLEDVHSALASEDDIQAAAGHIDPETGKSARNVWQEVHEYVGKVFVEDFAEPGDFSVTAYFENPGDRVVILQSDPTRQATLGPMYRLFLDWAMRHAMSVETQTDFLLDEVDSLPALTQLPTLASEGRSLNARTIVGTQTTAQLEERYREGADAILGNCPQGIFFSPGAGAQDVLDQVGKHREVVRSTSKSRDTDGSTSVSRREEDRYPVTSGDLVNFGVGQCLVVTRENYWVGTVHELADIEGRLP